MTAAAARAPFLRLLRDVAVLSGGELGAKVAGFLAFALLARRLDLAGYGAVELAAALAMVFSLVIDFGLGPIGARAVAREPAAAPALARAVVARRALLALLATCGMLATVQALDLSAASQRVAMLFALSLLALPLQLNWLLQGLDRMAAVAPASMLRMGVFLLGVAHAWVAAVAGSDGRTRSGAAPLDLSAVGRSSQLDAVLTTIPDAAERRFVADRIFNALRAEREADRLPLSQVGDLARLRVEAAVIERRRDLLRLRARLAAIREGRANPPAIRLLDPDDVRALRPLVAVRQERAFSISLWLSAAALLGAFALAHGVRRAARATGDPLLLPLTAALCGLGFLAMVSVNDPLRDRLLFESFAAGVGGGCVLLAGAALLDFRRLELHRFAFVFLAGALVLSALLVAFGSGPGASGAKVNLFGVQPVEAIRPLVALFLAGYFARRWELLRELREPRASAHPIVGRWRLPRIADLRPVVAGMALVLLFFFVQRDLGPALVLSCVFLVTYSVARDRWALAALGLLLLAAGFAGGYAAGHPSTVVRRIEMWMAPWDNAVPGGDQVAHALWALASGGWTGTGIGRGGTQFIPTGENDLVLASLGEDLGFLGLGSALLLFGLFAVRALRIARRTDDPYVALLVVGLVTSLVVQLVLIGGGLSGLLPLSGVVTPFLSLGRSSMISNLVVVGLLLAASRLAPAAPAPVFARPVTLVSRVAAVLVAVLAARAFAVQVVMRDDVMGRAVRTRQADGAIRAQENPRLREAALLLARGAIVDRRGVPLAVSDRARLEPFRAQLGAAGVAIAAACPDARARCYPLGGTAFHLLGDAATRANWGAPNSAFAERELDSHLRGYASASELVPLWDHRDDLDHPDARRLIERPRDVQLTIDARLQARVARLLAARLAALTLSRGAVVVMDATSGDVLASVSAPWPVPRAGRVLADEAPERADLPLLDRVRFGQYPPGSTFKLVTAAAALSAGRPFADEPFVCRRLADGRVGNELRGWRRPVRDDITDKVPHGSVTLEEGLRVSCNAYFAQLGLAVGARTLKQTAAQFEIRTASPDTVERLRGQLPWASHGQAEVVASPFRMARVAATFAAGGVMPAGRWIAAPADETPAGRRVVDEAAAERIARAMRSVVTNGTAVSLMASSPEGGIAGKTGTAEVAAAPSHSWFVGFAPAAGAGGAGPAGERPRRIAFAVLIENGGYGARAAVPLAGEVVAAARALGIIPD